MRYTISKDLTKRPIILSGFERIGTVERLPIRGEDGADLFLPRFGVLAKCPDTSRYVQLACGASFPLDQRSIKALLGIKNGAGRPRTVPRGQCHSLYISDSDFILLKELGGPGSASAGLRELLATVERCTTCNGHANLKPESCNRTEETL